MIPEFILQEISNLKIDRDREMRQSVKRGDLKAAQDALVGVATLETLVARLGRIETAAQLIASERDLKWKERCDRQALRKQQRDQPKQHKEAHIV